MENFKVKHSVEGDNKETFDEVLELLNQYISFGEIADFKEKQVKDKKEFYKYTEGTNLIDGNIIKTRDISFKLDDDISNMRDLRKYLIKYKNIIVQNILNKTTFDISNYYQDETYINNLIKFISTRDKKLSEKIKSIFQDEVNIHNSKVKTYKENKIKKQEEETKKRIENTLNIIKSLKEKYLKGDTRKIKLFEGYIKTIEEFIISSDTDFQDNIEKYEKYLLIFSSLNVSTLEKIINNNLEIFKELNSLHLYNNKTILNFLNNYKGNFENISIYYINNVLKENSDKKFNKYSYLFEYITYNDFLKVLNLLGLKKMNFIFKTKGKEFIEKSNDYFNIYYEKYYSSVTLEMFNKILNNDKPLEFIKNLIDLINED